MSNCHKPDNTVVKRRKIGHQGKLEVTAQQLSADYNKHMGAVDDVDRVHELLST